MLWWSYFVQKSLISKKHTAPMPVLFQKNVTSPKTRWSPVISLIFLWKTPCCHGHIWSTYRHFCQNYTTLWASKVNRVPFFPIFNEKITALVPIFCQKKLPFSKKDIILSKTACSHIIFLNFSWKTPTFMPIFSIKNVNSSIKTTVYYMSRKPIVCPFKITVLISIFCQKTSIL